MAREYGKALTKEMLQDWGITDIYQDINNEWVVNRYWYANNSKEKIFKQLSIQNAVCKHKYTTDKSYPIITFSFKQKVVTLPLARVIYAWFKGPIDAREVIDHINNDPYNNSPSNLQKLSVGENLAKRFEDNKKCNLNQYTTRSYNKMKNNPELYEKVHKMYETGKSYEEALVEVLKYLEENMEEK